MEHMLTDMKMTAEQTERRNAEMHASEERKHNEEIAFLKKTNGQLKVSDGFFLQYLIYMYLKY